jgi:hypothetical protein
MLQFLIYFFVFRFFFIAKSFEILVIDGFLIDLVYITAVLEFAVNCNAWWWWFGKEGDGHRG